MSMAAAWKIVTQSIALERNPDGPLTISEQCKELASYLRRKRPDAKQNNQMEFNYDS